MRTREKSLYNFIYLSLRRKIVAGHYPVGGMLPGEKSLLKEFGTTRTTVRRALSLLKNERLAVPVPGCGWKVQHVSPVSEHGKVGSVLFFAPPSSLGSYIFNEINSQYCRNFDNLLFCPINNYMNIGEESFSALAGGYLERNRPVGIIIFSDRHLGVRNNEFLSKIGIPVVLLGFSERCDFDSVSCDNEHGAKLILNKMVKEFGHKDITYFDYARFLDIPSFQSRVRGYSSAMLENSLTPSIYVGPLGFDMIPDFNKIFSAWLSKMGKTGRHPSAFLVSSDSFAYQLALTLKKLGLNVPADISICSFGSDCVKPDFRPEGVLDNLSYVKEPWSEIARIAVDKLLRRIRGISERTSLTLVAPTIAEGGTIMKVHGKQKENRLTVRSGK